MSREATVYAVVLTSDGEIHEPTDEAALNAILEAYGPEVVSYDLVDKS